MTNLSRMISDSSATSESDDDSDVAFSKIDFSGVDFDVSETTATNDKDHVLSADELVALKLEEDVAFQDFCVLDSMKEEELSYLANMVASGNYADVLRSTFMLSFLDGLPLDKESDARTATALISLVSERIESVTDYVCLEMVAVASLNLFLQANYTGPSLETIATDDINPHKCMTKVLDKDIDRKGDGNESKRVSKFSSCYQNAILAELAVEGDWPCQVCHEPYFLLLARVILSSLCRLARSSRSFRHFRGVYLWGARSIVAHQRLLNSRDGASATLFEEISVLFDQCQSLFCPPPLAQDTPNVKATIVMLERGLADHHFNRPGSGRAHFLMAREYSGLQVEVTGSLGKRTKFQRNPTAQMVVRVQSSAVHDAGVPSQLPNETKKHGIGHTEDSILLERIHFEDAKDNEIQHLNSLDQSVLLALCLDVKNNNPADGLTAEEMGAFLARVLDEHTDWMIYSTGLLERAWLEFERSHARERAILQMQALVDQHTNRLTITQSTQKSIEESAPVQDRLRNLHSLVYPPRWAMIQDLAERYAALGIVTTAAELFEEIEAWEDVVECYERAGRKAKAESIVRERLSIEETPRMWTALGSLSNDPEHYRRAIELSHGRFAKAYICLGQFYFDKGDLETSASNYECAVKVRPLLPGIWFRLGTIYMQLRRWDAALKAFSEVVQQEPEEADAWANVAAIHMHNKHPAEAYPALLESLRYNRNNWRVWISKLHTCLDLDKYDEAIHACNIILDFKAERQDIPSLEQQCVRAIVGGTIKKYLEAGGNEVGKESARRSLTRVHTLLDRLVNTPPVELWVFETQAFFQEQLGRDDKVLDYLMQEYRSLQAIQGWEKDKVQLRKICAVVAHVVEIHRRNGDQESLTKARFLVRGIEKKILASRLDDESLPEEVIRLKLLSEQIEHEIGVRK